jgi:hypothetical protein
MVKYGRSIAAASVLLLTLLAAGAAGRDRAESAADIIDKYFKAIGGRESAEAAENLVIGGYYGSVFLARGDSMTLYLKKPSSLRREYFGRVITYDGTSG